MKTHKDLEVYKNSIDFVTRVYAITKTFPKEEGYGLTSQLRRAAISIPSNIAEGAARGHDKEFIHFLYIAHGSLAEIETQLIIARNLNYLSLSELEPLNEKMIIIRSQLSGLIKHLKSKPK